MQQSFEKKGELHAVQKTTKRRINYQTALLESAHFSIGCWLLHAGISTPLLECGHEQNVGQGGSCTKAKELGDPMSEGGGG